MATQMQSRSRFPIRHFLKIRLVACFFLAASIGSSGPALAKQVDRFISNAAGNSYSASASYRLFVSAGETVVGHTSDPNKNIACGLLSQEPVPGFTATITCTPGPSATPTPTPDPMLADFQGELLDSKYCYVAPNPTRSSDACFKIYLKQAAEIEIRIYTPSGHHVLTKPFAFYPQGWNSILWHASNMANGVYLYVVEAKTSGVREKMKVKKLVLFKM